VETLLKSFNGMPFTHNTLLSLLTGYKSPNEKIHRWMAQGVLLQIKRGFYVVSPDYSGEVISLPLIANQLYGPSYVSLDYALYHYGLIPEKVVDVTSVTTKRSKIFSSGLGRFSYVHLPAPYYSQGIFQVNESERVVFLMASPEKALCDRLVLTRNLRIYSKKALLGYLLVDLRVDKSELQTFNIPLLKACASSGAKVELLSLLVKLVESLK
jgi:hypothetical protein